MWWNKEHLIVGPNEDLVVVIRTRLARRFLWQIQVRGSLVASGVGTEELVDQSQNVIQELDAIGLTDSAGSLRQLVSVLN